MYYDKVEVAGIKMSVAGIEGLGISSKKVLLKSIDYLRREYERSQDILFLKKAIWHIYAYLELGFPYDYGADKFLYILEYLHIEKKSLFLGKNWLYTAVPLNKSVVRNILGKWNPHLRSMKINDAVNDIIKNISEKKIGVYTYYSGRVIEKSDEKTLWEKTFKLYIKADEILLYDLSKNKYYVF